MEQMRRPSKQVNSQLLSVICDQEQMRKSSKQVNS